MLKTKCAIFQRTDPMKALTFIWETTMKIKSNVHVEWLVKYLVTNKRLKLVVVVMVEVETKWSKKNSFILPGP